MRTNSHPQDVNSVLTTLTNMFPAYLIRTDRQYEASQGGTRSRRMYDPSLARGEGFGATVRFFGM
jgi:hypothetical protein